MRDVAAAVWSPAGDRKIYVVWIGVVWAAILVGFGMDFAAIGGARHLDAEVRIPISRRICWPSKG